MRVCFALFGFRDFENKVIYLKRKFRKKRKVFWNVVFYFIILKFLGIFLVRILIMEIFICII